MSISGVALSTSERISGIADRRLPTQANTSKLLIAARVLGASGQPWLWRQVVNLGGFDRQLLCWQRRTTGRDPLSQFSLHVMPHAAAPYDDAGRWRHRIRNLAGRNFYAAVGQERRQLEALLRQEKPGVILCYFGDIAMRILPVAKAAGIPVVAYLHGDFLFVSNRWYRWSLCRCHCDFAAIVVVTEAERRWLLANGVPADKLHVIPCGAPTEVFRPRPGKPAGRVRIAMASRLVDEKGCHYAVEAFSRIVADLMGVELHVYGDGPERNNLQQQVDRLGLNGQVFFHGYVGEQQMAETLPFYDIFIQHSLRKEGSPVVIAEAMACGLPVVATSVGGVVDQVIDGKTGFLVAEHDVDGMAAAMRRLAGDPELRQRLGQAGRKRAVESYDSSRLTRRLEQLLMDVANP